MDSESDEDVSPYEFELRSACPRLTAVPPGLTQIIKAARGSIGPALASLIGPLSLTPLLVERNWSPAIQIRSKPLRAFGGAEFRHHVRLGNLAASYPVTAENLAESLKLFTSAQIYAADFGREIRAVVIDAMGQYDLHDTPVPILAIGLEVVASKGKLAQFATVVELELLGPDLAPRTVRIRRFSDAHLREALHEALTTQAKRANILRQHLKRGSACWIEETTDRLIQAAGLPMSQVHQFLGPGDYFTFKFDHRRQYGCIEWRDGVLICSAASSKGSFHLKNNNLTVRQRFPETLTTAFKGPQARRDRRT